MIQRQMSFYNHDGTLPYLPDKPTSEDIAEHLSDEDCALNKIIVSDKNQGNMEILRLFIHQAYTLHNHSCRGMSFAIYASAGQGKTYLVKQFAEVVGIPFVFVQSDALSDNSHLFSQIKKAFSATTPIVEVETNKFTIPPCIVFLDEIHALNSKVMDGLLNAMEYNDGMMRVTTGKAAKSKTIEIDCREICWVGATTEEGKLPGPFSSRLETSIVWHSAGPKEIYQIVQSHFPKFTDEACNAVAKYRRVPREAMAFARKMEWAKERDELTWDDAAAFIAKQMEIDEFGMLHREIAILKALGQRPIAKANLATVGKCNEEALDKIVMPPLLEHTENGPFVIPTRRGYTITQSGIEELNKRGIPNKGERITVEFMESE